MYDPRNSDKATLMGTIYEPDSLPVRDRIVQLQNRYCDISYFDTSNAVGEYGFEHIAPGIYTIKTTAKYYSDWTKECESLWAGRRLVPYNIFLTTLHFEDDDIGSVPYGFNKISGDWEISYDSSQGHSQSNVYKGINYSSNGYALSLFRSRGNFYDFGMRFKVIGSATQNWTTGVFLWYQDTLNYYYLKITKNRTTFGYLENGINTRLNTKLLNLSTETWYSLYIIRYDTQIRFVINDQVIFMFLASNILLSNGFWGIFVLNNDAAGVTSVVFDDVFIKPVED